MEEGVLATSTEVMLMWGDRDPGALKRWKRRARPISLTEVGHLALKLSGEAPGQ